MKGCLWGLPLSPSARIPEFHAPVPHSLGESHVSSVEQELLPPVSAHQRHRLLIQPNLCHTPVVREARHRLRDNRAGLTRLQAPGRGSVVTPLPIKDMSKVAPTEVVLEEASLPTLPISKVHRPEHSPWTQTHPTVMLLALSPLDR